MEKMTENQKQIVLKALCEGLPYGLLCDRLGQPRKLLSVSPYKKYCVELDNGEYTPNEYEIDEIKPYLRPLSSMTEEEKKIQNKYIYHFSGDNLINYEGDFVFEDEVHEYIEWLNANHLDYRGLITMGLAFEAPDGMYITKSS